MTVIPNQASANGHTISVNNTQLYYESYGEGPPLVLLHGFTETSHIWQPFIDDFAKHFQLIIPDLRGHGRSTNDLDEFTHCQSAFDIFALLDHLQISQAKAIGFSSGGETLIHMATQQSARIDAMILIGAASYWTEPLRKFCRESGPDSDRWDWEMLRRRHVHGDAQIHALINQLHACKDSYDDMNFTAPYLSTITAQTLILYGDRDPIYPLSIAFDMYNAIPDAHLWVVPNGGHGPFTGEYAAQFVQTALGFLQGKWATV